MLDRVARQAVEARLLDDVDETQISRLHIVGQRGDLGIDRRVQGLDGPAHLSLYSKKAMSGPAARFDRPALFPSPLRGGVRGGGHSLGTILATNSDPPPQPSPSRGEGAHLCSGEIYRTATGETVEPEPPWIFSGCMMKANSDTPFCASSSSFTFSRRCTPFTTSAS